MAVQHFHNVHNPHSPFNSNRDPNNLPDLSTIPLPTLIEQHKQLLSTTFTPEEIRKVICQLSLDNSPRTDGFTARFYDTFWEVVGLDFIGMIKSFFDGGFLLKASNQTLICLFPKETLNKIFLTPGLSSLCTGAYKFISKVFVMRLQRILDELISPNRMHSLRGG